MRSATGGNGGWPREGEALPQPCLRYARWCFAAWAIGAVLLFIAGGFLTDGAEAWPLWIGGAQLMAGGGAGFAVIVTVLRRDCEQENGD